MRTGLFVLILLLAAPARDARAYFESVRPGARALGLGEAYLPLAEDAWGIAWNPAGLARVARFEAVLQHETPYGRTNLRDEFAAGAVRLMRGGLGLGWSQSRLDGALTENLFMLGYGLNLLETTQKEFLALGGTLKLAHVSADGFGSDTALTGDLGFLLRPFSVVSLAYVIRNLGSPVLEIVPGGGGSALTLQHEYGFSFRWGRGLTVSYTRLRDSWARWHGSFGVEYRMTGAFAVRGGILRSRVAGGISWLTGSLSLDAGITVHEVLGTTYRFSIGVRAKGGGLALP